MESDKQLEMRVMRNGRAEPNESEWIELTTIEELFKLCLLLNEKEIKKLFKEMKNMAHLYRATFFLMEATNKEPVEDAINMLSIKSFRWIND